VDPGLFGQSKVKRRGSEIWQCMVPEGYENLYGRPVNFAVDVDANEEAIRCESGERVGFKELACVEYHKNQGSRSWRGEVAGLVTTACVVHRGRLFLDDTATSHHHPQYQICGRGDMDKRVSCSTPGGEYLLDPRKWLDIDESRVSCSCSEADGRGLGEVGVGTRGID
jgi:uncharacterized Zn-finger protein